jgi:hypothetical protein
MMSKTGHIEIASRLVTVTRSCFFKLSFGFKNILVGMDRACQNTCSQENQAQTDKRFPSYGLSKFESK